MTRIPALLLWALSIVAAQTALATESAAQNDQAPGLDVREWVQLDRVVATINDAVVLQSEVWTDAKGRIEDAMIRLGREMSPAERQYLFTIALQERIDLHALAQSAKTLGILPPERVEEIYQSELRADERDEVRNLGSEQRYNEELARIGWETFERRQRVRKMAELAQQMSVGTRLQNQRNLFITPRMMREFYRINTRLFVHEASATVGMIAFTGNKAPAHAREAAAYWRANELSPQQMEARFADRGARLPDTESVTEERKDSLVPQIFELGMAGPLGNVSEPVIRGNVVWVYKVLDFTAARAARFQEPEVQNEIRLLMERRVTNHLLEQTKRRAHDRTYVWMAPIR